MTAAAVLGILTAVLVGAVFAYTATNTVPPSRAGVGQNSITGYAIDSPHFTLDAADAGLIASVSFNVDSTLAPGSTVRARISPSMGVWYTCTHSGRAVTCNTNSPPAYLVDATELAVAVAQ